MGRESELLKEILTSALNCEQNPDVNACMFLSVVCYRLKDYSVDSARLPSGSITELKDVAELFKSSKITSDNYEDAAERFFDAAQTDELKMTDVMAGLDEKYRVLKSAHYFVNTVCNAIFEEKDPAVLSVLKKYESIRMRRAPEAKSAVPTKTDKISEISKKAERLKDFLLERVFGQERAINVFTQGYFQAELMYSVKKDHNGPRATFLFAGSPGVGKTYLSEAAAEFLRLPFMRFDMSEYNDRESASDFCGVNKSYKESKEGNVTGFVARNRKCILLFDEIEKAHHSIINLFLQLLDGGRLRDNFTEQEVSFKGAIIIFTTNAGKALYENESVNLATVSSRTVLGALAKEKKPDSDSAVFPAPICSRFAFGNVVMFNRMTAANLLAIAEREIKGHVDAICESTGLTVNVDPLLPYAVLFAEGGGVDGRTIKGRSRAFVYGELQELFRLMDSSARQGSASKIDRVDITVKLPSDEETTRLFVREGKPKILVLAEKEIADRCAAAVKNAVFLHADNLNAAKKIIKTGGVDFVLCDVAYGKRNAEPVLNIEDVDSEGRDLFRFVTEKFDLPLYAFECNGKFEREEAFSLVSNGARGIVCGVVGNEERFRAEIEDISKKLYQQNSLMKLARANRILTYKTLQNISDNGKSASIVLFDFKRETAIDATDVMETVGEISRPDISFDDVIGANDAKEELKYFVQYLKNPAKFVGSGVKAPRGVLLYGPPGTGKTLLAKAMAKESNVTFINAEGNRFLKKYVGDGAQYVHRLFNIARKYSPSILFIDEIDAIGRARGSETATSEVASDVLTAFLTETDGFTENKDRPVFVLAATNFSAERGSEKCLDGALLRRFDRRIKIDLPNKAERKEFIARKIKKLNLTEVTDTEADNLAERSVGASLAELDSVFELALRNLIRANGREMNDEMLEEAFETFNGGEIKRWGGEELLQTARHEAGHALLAYLSGETPSYVTVVARGNHGGYMQQQSKEDKGTFTRAELLNRIAIALGGRAAEVVFYGKDGITTGASSDLRQATETAKALICDYGMDEKLGAAAFGFVGDAYFGRIAERVNEILAEQLERASSVIEKHKRAVDALAHALVDKNSLRGLEIAGILSICHED